MKKHNLFKGIILSLIAVFLILGCRQELTTINSENISAEVDFFRNLEKKLANSPKKNEIISRIKLENGKTHFLNKINQHQGVAKWEKSLILSKIEFSEITKTDEEIMYINVPYTDSQKLTSVFFIKYDSTNFWATDVDNKKLRDFVNDDSVSKEDRESVLMNYLLLDKMIFNTSSYKEIPKTLFSELSAFGEHTKSIKIISYNIPTSKNTIGKYEDLFCISVEDDVCSCHGGSSYTTYCYSTGGGGGVISGGGTGIGDGSGSGTIGGGGSSGGASGNTDCNNSSWYKDSSCDGGIYVPPSLINFEQQVSNYGYDISSYRAYLMDNDEVRMGLMNYFNTNNSQNSANFVSWSLTFLTKNLDVTWTQFQNWFIEGAPDGFTTEVINYDPKTILEYETLTSPEFKIRKVDQIKYPIFTALLKVLKTKVEQNPTMLNRLSTLTGLTNTQVLEKLTFGKGPTINIIPNLTGPSGPNYGNFDSTRPNEININANFVLGLETSTLESTKIATAFLLAVTVLHEFIHYGNFLTGYDTQGQEMGNLFEIDSYGVIVTKYNAYQFIVSFKNK